jgi:hypothetical protein
MRFSLAIFIITACSFTTTAQIQFTVEEDFFAGPLNRDANYTGGFFLSIPCILARENSNFVFPSPMKKIAPDIYNKLMNVSTSFQLGSVGFTPEDIGSTNVIFDDRPYSSSLFIGYNQLYKSSRYENLFEYRLDYFGLRVIDKLQKAIHLAMDTTDGRPVPMGWDYQIADFKHTNVLGAIMPNIRFTHARFISGTETSCFRGYLKAGASVGTQTYGHALAGFRLGNSHNGLFSYGNVPLAKSTYEESSNKDLYLTFEASVNAWAYNGFLQGIRPEGNDSHRFEASDIKRYTTLLELGIHRTYKNTYLNYKLSRRSAEFIGNKAVTHWWGALTIGFKFCN